MSNNATRTVGEALTWATRLLRPLTSSPRLEAELLLAHLLQRARPYLLAHTEASLTPEQAATYAAHVARRAGGEPLPYITGYMEFYGLDFTVTPAVLIPRPETELLVKEALRWLQDHPQATAADIGTGSGCIAVTLAVQAPALRLIATDCSTAALTVARANAMRHGVAGRITFLEGDLLAPLPAPVELLVSNPPYVAEDEWDTLPPSVQREPRLALHAGPEGLDALRRLLAQAPASLRPGGLLLVEIGERQGAAARSLAQAAFPHADLRILTDLAGKERVLRVQRVD